MQKHAGGLPAKKFVNLPARSPLMVKQEVFTCHCFFWRVELFVSLRLGRLTSEEPEEDVREGSPPTKLKPSDRSVGVACAIDLHQATQPLGVGACEGKKDFVSSTGIKEKTFRSDLTNHEFGKP